MDYSKPGFWIAIGSGGFIIGLASLIQQYANKQPTEPINYRAIFRDFFIGAFLTATIYMFLPESIDSLISAATNMIPKTTPLTQSGGADIPAGPIADIELQCGPARF
jgi:hypothetical protein